jgi:PAS domain S-box-containing protein
VTGSVSPLRSQDGRGLGAVFFFRDIAGDQARDAALERFKSTLDQTLDCIFVYSAIDFRFLYVNEGGRKQLGYSDAELLRMTVLDIKTSYTEEKFREAVRPLLDDPSATLVLETAHRRKDGREIPVEASLRLVREAGKEPRFVTVARDITERKRLENRIQQREGLLHSVLDSIGSWIAVLDRDGDIIALNSDWERAAAASDERILLKAKVGENYLAVCRNAEPVAGDAAREIHFGLRRVLQREEDSFSCEYACHSATAHRWYAVNASPLSRAEGGAVVAHVDITKRRLAEQTLVDFKAALDEHAIVAITDAFGAITYVNDKFCAISKYSRAELIGRSHRLINSGRHPREFYHHLWRTISRGAVWRGEIQNRAKDGSYYWVDTTIVPIREAGRSPQYIAIRTDVTARKEVEERLTEAIRRLRHSQAEAQAANAAKSRFLANMSHEIRTPMNAILGYAQLMLRDSALGPEARANLRIMNRSGEHLMALINDVLDMSKIEAGRAELHPGTFSLPDLLDSLESMFRLRAEAKALQFSLLFEREPATYLVTDEGKLRQVLMNLVSNAIKFTRRGTVTLRIGLQPREDRLWLSASIEDTGIGMSARELENLFEPFTQTRSAAAEAGTGLGLAISREFVRLMGGELTVTSEPGYGSIFRFEIPVERGVAEPVAAAGAYRRVAGIRAGQAAPRVLVADDQFENRDWMVKLLTAVGYDVRAAENGESALRIWAEWRPHAIVMDVRMPVMDGAEATRRIKADPRGAETIIIALTASAMEEQRNLALRIGFDDFIAKPCKEDQLLERLRSLLGIEYVYDDPDPAELPETAALAALNADMRSLRRLPAETIDALREATLSGNKALMDSLIAAIRESDVATGSALQGLADQYEYVALIRLLEEACRP